MLRLAQVLILVLLGLMSMSSLAENHLIVSHQVIGVTPQTSGSKVTFEISVTNNGQGDLKHVTLQFLEHSLLDPKNNTIILGRVPLNGTSVITCTLDSPRSTIYFSQNQPLSFLAKAKTPTGENIAIPLTSNVLGVRAR